MQSSPDSLRHTAFGPRAGRRAAEWQLRSRKLLFPARPLLMGIVNVTPDSFSDGAEFATRQAAVAQALRLAAAGADMIDLGGESTRPYAEPVPAELELERVVPVVREVCRCVEVPVSIDTYKATVAAEAIDAGAEIINDVTGLTGDPGMLDVAVKSQAGVCVMHMQGTPQTMQDNPSYDDVVAEVLAYLSRRHAALVAAGIDAARICVDPGIGFGKTHEHNLTLLREAERFHELDCPVLIGHSRKGFLGKVLGDKMADRTAATVGVALAMALCKIQILRVHDVRPVLEALLLFEAAGGFSHGR